LASPEEQLQESIASAVAAAQSLEAGTVTRLTVDVQSNGQLPYQVAILEEQLPYVGLALSPVQTPSQPAANRAERSGQREGSGRG
jgi:hypothetical protein